MDLAGQADAPFQQLNRPIGEIGLLPSVAVATSTCHSLELGFSITSSHSISISDDAQVYLNPLPAAFGRMTNNPDYIRSVPSNIEHVE